MDSNDPDVDAADTVEVSPKGPALDPGSAAYDVRFSKFLTASRASNSFDLARRGQIQISGDHLLVKGFQRDFMFMGRRIEFGLPLADITDVSQVGDLVRLRVATSSGELRKLQMWTRNEEDAKSIVLALPTARSTESAAVDAYQAQLALLKKGDPVTNGLVAANVLVFFAAAIAGAGFFVSSVAVLQSWGTNFGPLTTDGQWWRLVSSMFLHFGVFHLALNMWALFIGGRLAERLFGSWAFALLYFAAGLGGSLASLLWNPAVNSAGASGAIFGVYGGMLAFFLRKHTAIPASVIKQQRYSGMVFIGYNLLNGFSHAGIDNADHVGGLAVGFVLGLVLARPLDLKARQVSQASFYLKGAVAACALVGALFIAMQFSPAGNGPDQQFRRDISSMVISEKDAQQFAKDAFDQLNNRTITRKEFSEMIENEVLPRWTAMEAMIAKHRVPDNSKLKPLWDLVDDYSESRLAAYRLFASGGKRSSNADFEAGQAKLDQGEIDLKLMKDLNQRNK